MAATDDKDQELEALIRKFCECPKRLEAAKRIESMLHTLADHAYEVRWQVDDTVKEMREDKLFQDHAASILEYLVTVHPELSSHYLHGFYREMRDTD